MSSAIPHVPTPTLAVAESDERFPIHRIYCVARNYADHAREMGHDPTQEPPFFFMKPADAGFTVAEGYASGKPGVVPFPPGTSNLHHEIELVVALGSGGTSIPVEDALSLVWGYAAGVDLTRRDLQDAAKNLRRPWDLSKGFDASAPVSVLVPSSSIGHPDSNAIELTVNGELRQRGNLANQIWSVPEIISYLSTFVELRPGDLVMTGTPAGVGPLKSGDVVQAAIEGVAELEFWVR